MYNVR